MSALVKYEIKFKRFVNGVWDEKFRITTVEAENQYQAVWHLGTYNDDHNIEDIIVMVSSETGNPATLMPGCTYTTNGGDKVKMAEFKDLEGRGRTTYETIMDENGHHRYSRRDIGRCTGSYTNDPGNIQLGVFWMRYDINDPYDYVMQRKYSDNGLGVKSNETVKTCL